MEEFIEVIDNKEVTIVCKEDELEIAIIAISPLIQEGCESGYSPRWYINDEE